MAIVSIVSLLASISAMTFAGPRVYFAMGRDGVFFSRAAAVHPRYRTPAVSILAQATWSSLLVLTAGADALVTYTGFAIVLFSGVAVVALFVLRAREPNAERPFRAWGYPVAPAIYVVASAAILLNGLYQRSGDRRAMARSSFLPAFRCFCCSRKPSVESVDRAGSALTRRPGPLSPGIGITSSGLAMRLFPTGGLQSANMSPR